MLEEAAGAEEAGAEEEAVSPAGVEELAPPAGG